MTGLGALNHEQGFRGIQNKEQIRIWACLIILCLCRAGLVLNLLIVYILHRDLIKTAVLLAGEVNSIDGLFVLEMQDNRVKQAFKAISDIDGQRDQIMFLQNHNVTEIYARQDRITQSAKRV